MALHLYEIFLYGLLLAIICICMAKNKAKSIKKEKTHPTLPEPAGAWPLIGHFRLLETEQLLHQTLGAMADNYGPAFGIRLGTNRVLVVSNREVAKECFTANDKLFSSRPRQLTSKLALYDESFLGFAPYGPYWRELRKIVMTQLLSTHRLELSKHVRETEIKFLLDGLYRKCMENGGSAIVNMKDRFGRLGINIMVRSVVGKRFDEDCVDSKMCQMALTELNRLLGIFYFSDTIPILGWLDVVNGWVGEIKRRGKEIDNFLGRWVNEHREKKLAGEINEREKDFMDIMLSIMHDGRPVRETDTVVKATCLNLIGAGSETTAITLTWALSLLLNNGRVLKEAQDELDSHIGKNRQVEVSDLNNLRYINAIIKETLRLYPPAPLSVARISMEDCTVAGFHIPKDTQLLVNLWKLHRDPRFWTNPSEFVPERFFGENKDLDVRGKDFKYLPFGSGRRMCPGNTFASQVISLALARLLHGFEFRTVSDRPVDMSEGLGLTLPKKTPLEVVLTPRLSAAPFAS